MPVEIKELVIRAIYNKAEKPRPPAAENGRLSEQARLELIEACVEQVMALLEKKNRR